MSLAKIAGIKYEQQFLMFLRKEFPQVYIRPHVHFRDGGDHRTVIPDAVLFCDDDQGRPQTKIFEVKRQHMPEAWWQLERLYRPVLQAAFPSHYIACVEVVRTYDSQMPWPEEHVLFNDLKHAVLSSDKIGVLKWRKP